MIIPVFIYRDKEQEEFVREWWATKATARDLFIRDFLFGVLPGVCTPILMFLIWGFVCGF